MKTKITSDDLNPENGKILVEFFINLAFFDRVEKFAKKKGRRYQTVLNDILNTYGDAYLFINQPKKSNSKERPSKKKNLCICIKKVRSNRGYLFHPCSLIQDGIIYAYIPTLAKKLGLSEIEVLDIIDGSVDISKKIANKIGPLLGIDTDLILKMQSDYNAKVKKGMRD